MPPPSVTAVMEVQKSSPAPRVRLGDHETAFALCAPRCELFALANAALESGRVQVLETLEKTGCHKHADSITATEAASCFDKLIG